MKMLVFYCRSLRGATGLSVGRNGDATCVFHVDLTVYNHLFPFSSSFWINLLVLRIKIRGKRAFVKKKYWWKFLKLSTFIFLRDLRGNENAALFIYDKQRSAKAEEMFCYVSWHRQNPWIDVTERSTVPKMQNEKQMSRHLNCHFCHAKVLMLMRWVFVLCEFASSLHLGSVCQFNLYSRSIQLGKLTQPLTT